MGLLRVRSFPNTSHWETPFPMRYSGGCLPRTPAALGLCPTAKHCDSSRDCLSSLQSLGHFRLRGVRSLESKKCLCLLVSRGYLNIRLMMQYTCRKKIKWSKFHFFPLSTFFSLIYLFPYLFIYCTYVCGNAHATVYV